VKIARAGLPTVTALILLAAAGYFASPIITGVLAFPLALALWFYRDPERSPLDNGPDVWLSPADGRVVEVEDAFDPYAGSATKIGIFMNGFDVHVNRFPIDGIVDDIVYVPGEKWFAFAPKASEVNERLYVHATTTHGKTTIVQIAGIMARRITCYTKEREHLARGERYGMIKLGSKVDIYLPKRVLVSVKIGDKVKAGESAIGAVRGK
jgi:phosphatidylserine decarboxylase